MIGSFRRGLAAIALASALVLLFPLIARAAPGDLDSTFNNTGMQTTDLGSSESGTAIARLAGGKLLVLGRTGSGAADDVVLVRYRDDGIPDPGFGGGDGIVTASLLGDDDPDNGLVVLPSGKIMVAAETEAATGLAKLGLFRFMANGNPDTTFGGGDGKLAVGFGDNAYPYDMVRLGSGKLLVAGEIDPTNNKSSFLVARLNPNGTLDHSFGGGDGFVTTKLGPRFDGAWRVRVDGSGRIVAGGWVEEGLAGSDYDVGVVRYTPSGALDHTFSGDGKVITQLYQDGDDWIYGLALQGSKIVAGVYADDHTGTHVALIRYLSNGKLDPTFGGGDGEVITPHEGGVSDIAVDSSNRIVVVGDESQMFVARYRPNGALDTGFGTNGFSATSFSSSAGASGLTIAVGGKIAVVGSSNGNIAVARFLP